VICSAITILGSVGAARELVSEWGSSMSTGRIREDARQPRTLERPCIARSSTVEAKTKIYSPRSGPTIRHEGGVALPRIRRLLVQGGCAAMSGGSCWGRLRLGSGGFVENSEELVR
jgi:hypothetical protein